ncbi:hypothetical protein KC573_01630, partial [candidate division WWE3 bacterium]|nr:hypothetical protein [candidate division WWE3 bacterium]
KATYRNVLDNFEDLSIEVWAQKDTYLLSKLQINFIYLINTEEFSPLVQDTSLPLVAGASKVLSGSEYQDVVSGSISIEYTNYNNATPIQFPTNAESLNEYLDTIDPVLYGITLNPQEELLRVNNAQVKSDINQIGIALEAHATQNGGEYPETLDGLVSTLYLQKLPILPESRSIYCDTSLNYIRTDDAKYAAVWIDLEPCPASPAENASTFFVYKTACKLAFEQTGLVPTKNSLTESCE